MVTGGSLVDSESAVALAKKNGKRRDLLLYRAILSIVQTISQTVCKRPLAVIQLDAGSSILIPTPTFSH